MGATAFATTTVIQPHVVGINKKMAEYTCQLPSSWPVAGVAIDLTDDFKYVESIEVLGSKAYTDHGYKFDGVVPDHGVAATSSNVKLAGHWGAAGTAAVYPPIPDTTDLSAITDLRIRVTGR